MNKFSSPISVLDFGSTHLGLAIYENQILTQSVLYEEKIDYTKNQDSYALHTLSNIINKAEKNIGQHLNDILLLVDSSCIFSLDFSINKNFEKKIITKDDINHLIIESENIVRSSYKSNYILHTIISKVLFDNKIIDNLENMNHAANLVSVDLKFILISKKTCDDVKDLLFKKYISVNQIFCTSYFKSLGLIKKFSISGYNSFIDIGHKKSSLTIFNNDKFLFMNNTHIGGNHITKDISKILKIDYRIAEAKKIKFSKNKNYKNINNENELLKKIINSRLEEIIELLFNNCPLVKNNVLNSKLSLYFTGNGSKVLNENLLSFGPEFDFVSEMSTMDEFKKDLFDTTINFHSYNQKLQPSKSIIKLENKGFFEKLFEYFSRN